MDLFTIDTAGESDLLHADKYTKDVSYHIRSRKSSFKEESVESVDGDEAEDSEDSEEYDFGGLPPPSVDVLAILRNPLLYTEPLYGGKCGESKETSELETFCKAMGWTEVDGMLRKRPEVENKNGWRVEDLIDIENVHGDWAKANVKHEMKTSQTKGIEKLRSIEKLTDRKAAELRRIERSKTKGSDWYGMPATEVTEELRQDLEIIQMRSALNPTHFYKKNDLKTLPKFFQVGTVLPSALERHNERGLRVNKKKSLVDELLEDAQFQQFNKRKYKEIMAEKTKTGLRRAYKKMKSSKKK